MRNRIPAQRLAAFDLLAAAKDGPVVVVVRNATVRRQYLRAFEQRGVDLGRVYFRTFDEQAG